VANRQEFTDCVAWRPWPGYDAQKNTARTWATGDWVAVARRRRGVIAELRAEIARVLPPTARRGSTSPAQHLWGDRVRQGGLYTDRQLGSSGSGPGPVEGRGGPRIRCAWMAAWNPWPATRATASIARQATFLLAPTATPPPPDARAEKRLAQGQRAGCPPSCCAVRALPRDVRVAGGLMTAGGGSFCNALCVQCLSLRRR